jgi:hypothetical protein
MKDVIPASEQRLVTPRNSDCNLLPEHQNLFIISTEVLSLSCPATCSSSPTTLSKKDMDSRRIEQDFAILSPLV